MHGSKSLTAKGSFSIFFFFFFIAKKDDQKKMNEELIYTYIGILGWVLNYSILSDHILVYGTME